MWHFFRLRDITEYSTSIVQTRPLSFLRGSRVLFALNTFVWGKTSKYVLSQPLRTEHQLETELQSLIWLEPIRIFLYCVYGLAENKYVNNNSNHRWHHFKTMAVTFCSLPEFSLAFHVQQLLYDFFSMTINITFPSCNNTVYFRIYLAGNTAHLPSHTTYS